MPIERVGYSRIYKAESCSTDGRPYRLHGNVAGVTVDAIFGGEFSVPVMTFRLGRPVPKGAPAERPTKSDTNEPWRQEPPADFFGAGAYLELVGSCPVEVDCDVSTAFHRRESEASNVILGMAEERREELTNAVDLMAGAIGLRLHARWVSGEWVERLIAFRDARSASVSTGFRVRTVPSAKVDAAALSAFASRLPPVRCSLPHASTVLSWLLRAWGESEDPVNEFLSLFVPLEMILGEPEPPDEVWSERALAVTEIVRLHGGYRATELLQFLEKAVQPPSVLVRRFAKLAARAAMSGWEADVRAVRQFASIRRDLLHRGRKREVTLKASVGLEEVRTLEDIVERYVSHVLFDDVAVHDDTVRPEVQAAPDRRPHDSRE